jgi:hypothetical protein
MPTIAPKWRFAIQVVVFIAVGVSQGAVHLTNMIPGAWIPYALSWCGFIAFIGTGLTTGLSGLGLTPTSRIAAAASLPDVQQIVTTPALAKAAGPVGDGAKVVSNGH